MDVVCLGFVVVICVDVEGCFVGCIFNFKCL